MPNHRKGYVGQYKDGRWFARVTVTDDRGKRRNIVRRAGDKAEARELLKSLLRQIDDKGSKAADISRLTFNDLADFYEQRYLHEAVYVDGQKLSGLRDVRKPREFLKHFRAFFGRKKLRDISHGDLIGYRDERFKVLTQYKRKRTLASWNREAAVLRRIFSVGCQQDWLDKNPFRRGDSLIIISAERRREKILTVSEEARLLAACDSHPYRKPLKALLIFLIDSGCRKGEALQLRFRSVSFATRLVTLEGTTTKTLKTRQVMMTSRVFQQLMTLWEASTKEPNARVFGITDNVRKSFASVCKIAGIKHGGVDGLTLHSLRHTAASRLVAGGMSIELAGKLLGHSPRTNTTYKWYLSADVETAVRAVEILESFQPDQGHTYDVETPDAAPYQVQQIEGVQ